MGRTTLTMHAQSSVAHLRRFTRNTVPQVERCDLCSLELAQTHQHLVEPQARRLLCVCDACALLFCEDGTTRYRRVPRDPWMLKDLEVGHAQWEALGIPIGLVFIFHSSVAEGVVAIYPSPAGPTESPLDRDAWGRMVQENPVLERMRTDIEALLVNRMGEAREYYLAPIDKCYELVGVLRANWRGVSGGEQVRDAITTYFRSMRERSRVWSGTGSVRQA